MERRLATFDGILAVSSPPGGPTIVVIEVPWEGLNLAPSDDDNRRVLAVLAYLGS